MREKIEVTLEENGETLRFQIEKMPAYQSLLWKKRAFSTIDLEKIVADLRKMDNVNRDEIGLKIFTEIAKMPEDDFKILLDGLISCCYILRENVPVKLTPSNIDGFFSESETLMNLAFKAFEVNGFFPKSGKAESPTFPAPADIKRRV